jgi:pyruvate formate lyase activating enzyme
MNAASSTKSRPPESGPRPIRLQPLQGPATVAKKAPAVGGVVPFSSVDWLGQLAAVIFIAGCPWNCRYCHNPHLQVRERRFDWRAVCAFLRSRRGLLDGIVFSGGEPLSEPRLPSMIRTVKAIQSCPAQRRHLSHPLRGRFADAGLGGVRCKDRRGGPRRPHRPCPQPPAGP